jgi:hypothetical protein
MRSTVVAILLLFSTSAMAATYIPVHTAPVVHVNPVADQNSGPTECPMKCRLLTDSSRGRLVRQSVDAFGL